MAARAPGCVFKVSTEKGLAWLPGWGRTAGTARGTALEGGQALGMEG